MVSALANFGISFLAGLFAPIGAVCVLPLYPAFLAYLASQLSTKSKKKTILLLGVIVTLGVVASMFVIGLIFTQLLQASLTRAIGIISPIAFGILALISLVLIFNIDISKFLPKFRTPVGKKPLRTAFGFGFFFGAIVLPCNPASLIVLFAISTSTTSFITNFGNFLFFGIGMGLPLLLFSAVSAAKSSTIMGFLTKRKRGINLTAGLIMLTVSLYYIIFVFRVFG